MQYWRWLIPGVLVVVLGVLQASLVPELRVYSATPHLTLLFVVGWSLLAGLPWSLPWAFAAGLLLDLASGSPLGLNALALLPVALMAGAAEGNALRGNLALPVIAAGAGVIVYYLFLVVEQETLGYGAAWLSILVYVVVPSAVLNAVIMPPFYWLLSWIHRGTHPRTRAEW